MRWLLRSGLKAFGGRVTTPFAISFADGTRYQNVDGAPSFHLRFHTPGAEWRAAWLGYVGILDAYIDGTIDIDGDLAFMFRSGMANGFDAPNRIASIRNRWHEWRHGNSSWDSAKANARFHYGLGVDFYRRWLDSPYMMYTCGYWHEGVRTLEEAQLAKIEHVCRKIRLAPGETVVDIGCGFGGFMRYAAEHRGAVVTGVNTTSEQVTSLEADMKNWKPAPGDRPRVVETDFRDSFASFDKVVSIGVLEHAGRDQLDAVIRAHAEFLKPGGLGVLHFIGHVGPRETEFFIRHYVFPGGWIPALSDVIQSMERWGLEVIDIENLRRHYALTLDEWLRRFDHAWPELQAQDRSRFDERFRRIWRTYLLACAEMFRSSKGQTHLYQITFSKGNLPSDATPGAHPGTYPMGRGFLYPSISTLRNSNARAHP